MFWMLLCQICIAAPAFRCFALVTDKQHEISTKASVVLFFLFCRVLLPLLS